MDSVSKRGKDKRPFLTSTPFLLLLMVAGTGAFWFFGREPAVKTLPYGELMQILQANDPGLHWQNVKVGKAEIRRDIVTTNTVSTGKTTPAPLLDKLASRTLS